MGSPGKIDAVVTWVDGSDPAFQDRFHRSLGPDAPDPESEAFRQRFVSGHEILLCLTSIQRFGSCIDRIFVVTDRQDPRDRFPQLAALGARLQIVDHTVIFDGIADALPCFNSQAIGSLLWRIPGITDTFLYFNDDCLLFRETGIDDLMPGGQPELHFHSRRPWRKHTPADFPRYHAFRNAALLLRETIPDAKCHLPAHFPSLFQKTAFEQLFRLYPAAFEENTRLRIRNSERGFAPSILHHNFLRETGRATASYEKPGLYIGGHEPEGQVAEQDRRLQDPDFRYLCLNDLAAIQAHQPAILSRIETHVMGAAWRPAGS